MTDPQPKRVQKSYSGRVVSGAIWLATAKAANLFASLGAIAVLARLLSPAEFGIVAAAQLIVTLGDALSRGAFAAALVQREAITVIHQRTALWASLCLSFVLAGVVALVAPSVERFFEFDGLGLVLIGMSAMLPFRAAGTVGLAMLQRHHRFASITMASVAAYILGYAIPAVALAFAGFGVWSLVVGQVTGALLEATILALQARLSLRPSFNVKALRLILGFGGYFILVTLCNWAARQIDSVIVGRILGAEALGYYSRGINILSLATTLLSEAVSRVLFPTFSRMQDDIGRLRSAFTRVFGVAVPIYFCLAAFVVLHAEAMVRILLGPKWLVTVVPLQLLFVAFPARAGYKYSESLLFGIGRARQAALRQFAYFSVIGIGAYVGSFYNVAAVAGAVSMAIWGFYAVSVIAVSWSVGVSSAWLLTLHGRSLLLAVVIGAADYGVQIASDGLGFWAGQVLAAAAFGLLFVVTALFGPRSMLGAEIEAARTLAMQVAKNRWQKRRRNGT